MKTKFYFEVRSWDYSDGLMHDTRIFRNMWKSLDCLYSEVKKGRDVLLILCKEVQYKNSNYVGTEKYRIVETFLSDGVVWYDKLSCSRYRDVKFRKRVRKIQKNTLAMFNLKIVE